MVIKAYKLINKPGGTYNLEGTKVQLILANGQKSFPLKTPEAVVFHWTAGSHVQMWDDYHFNIVFDANTKEAKVVQTLNWAQLGQHLWGRNTGTVAITFSAMSRATSNNFGAFPVTPQQVEAAAILAAEICAWKRINPHEVYQVPDKTIVRGALVNTGGFNTVPRVSDHAFYASLDGYASERWDVGPYMGQLTKLVQKYYDELKAKKREFMFKELMS
jgi:hypothetical protein